MPTRNKMRPVKVSIIMPVYNASRTIGNAIRSVCNQTHQDWELLITDDCSTDNTVSKLHKYAERDPRIRVFKLKRNSGAGIARNHSLMHATGRYIAFCDSDDQWMVGKLSKQLEFMLKNDLALSYTSYLKGNHELRERGKITAPKRISYRTMLRNNYIGCLTAMYDTKKIGKRNMPGIRKRQDWVLWLNILKEVPFAMGLQEALAIYRNRKKSFPDVLTALKYNWIVYREYEGCSCFRALVLSAQYWVFYIMKRFKAVPGKNRSFCPDEKKTGF